MIDPALLRKVDKMLVERYSTRLRKFGDDPRTLGWNKSASQQLRFNLAINSVKFSGQRILDVGCGLADFLRVLLEEGINPESYTGCDINPDLLNRCASLHPSASFHRANFLLDPVPGGPFDTITLFGLGNFRFREFSNEDYIRQLIAKSYEIAENTVVIDMLTARRDLGYPQEDFVYYYEPCKILNFALGLTPHVTVRHDYSSIPQREMMLILRKQPWR